MYILMIGWALSPYSGELFFRLQGAINMTIAVAWAANVATTTKAAPTVRFCWKNADGTSQISLGWTLTSPRISTLKLS